MNGSGRRIAPAAPSSDGNPLIATPSSSSTVSAWNVSATPSPSAAAQTETAVPPSISRRPPRTPPAPHPISPSGARASWTPSSVASGAMTWAPVAKTMARSALAAAETGPRLEGGIDGRAAGIAAHRQPRADVDSP